MPALLERPKLSNAMARALHRHIMMERERKRQEEEEVDKMMEQKMKEEQERRKKKEMEERMSLEETKEQILKLQEKLLALQEEKHQLFLQLKKVLHEEEKRRRKEQSDLTTLTSAAYPQSLTVHTGTHLLSMQGSPGGHSRPGTLMAADRAKQMFGPQVLTTRHYVGSAAAFAGTPEHGQFQGSPGGAYGTAQPPPHYGPTQPAYSPSQQLRAPSAFPAVQYLSQPQPQPYAVHGHFQPAQTEADGTRQPADRFLRLLLPAPHASPSSASSPWTPCLSPAPCADAASRKVGLCSYQPAWPSAPLHPAQPEPTILPQVIIRFYLQAHPQPLPRVRAPGVYQSNKIYLPPPLAAVLPPSLAVWRVQGGGQVPGRQWVGNELSSKVQRPWFLTLHSSLTHLIQRSN
ncbi:G protein pathway suppressor 2 isoform X1 [Ursus americanus]|uniref:G protein pathway suppressor 2 isoform X1 n=1 Tax=Ursus americanus TaxID=9643 RepID=UPI001E679DDC|nr:G protein pathway suppressor 2 isoform X1 [Ursus americanus]